MEPFYNNTDEEKEIHARRSARIEQMKREKQLQEQRRRKVKKCLPYAMGAIGAVIIIIALIVLMPTKRKEGENQQVQIEESNDLDKGNDQDSENSFIQNADENISQQAETLDDAIAAASGTADTPASMPLYSFKATDDTVTIYSEEVASTNAILINESTDTIIAQKGARQRICPASMTKVLTVLVAAENITKENLDDTFTMTLDITDYAYVNDCSSVGFLEGEVVTVRDLFYGTVLPSGGDAAVGLATYIAGSHEEFVDMMNEKLEELGLADSAHFTNCVGLYDDNHYCTVYDMAVIMKAAIQNELCREFLSLHTYTTSSTEAHPEGITISNWFLRRIEDKDTGGEVLCAKTGYVVQSKNCAVSYEIKEDGVPYICVTAGAHSSWRCIYDHVEIYNQYTS